MREEPPALKLRADEPSSRSGAAPSVELLSPESFENAIVVLAAMGGSTNAIVHLLALAGRVGVPLTLSDFDAIFRRTPMITMSDHLVSIFSRTSNEPEEYPQWLRNFCRYCMRMH